MSLGEEIRDWSYEMKCQQAVKSLTKSGFTAIFCQDRQEATAYIIKEAEEAATIGFGGSVSLVDLEVYNTLKQMGKELLVHTKSGLSLEQRIAVMRRQLTCDLLLTGTNALTLTGSLVNMDATGNRTAAMIYGPKKVIVIAGRNKLVDGVDEAINRIKNYAAPANSKNLNYNTPCAKTGFCSDCDSPERICRITSIIERKPKYTDISVLVVNEDLGF